MTNHSSQLTSRRPCLWYILADFFSNCHGDSDVTGQR